MSAKLKERTLVYLGSLGLAVAGGLVVWAGHVLNGGTSERGPLTLLFCVALHAVVAVAYFVCEDIEARGG